KGPNGFEFLLSEGQEVPELSHGADSILRLPSPIVPVLVGHVAPERVTSGFTGRLFFLNPGGGREDRAGVEPGTLFGFVHLLRYLQKTRISGVRWPCLGLEQSTFGATGTLLNRRTLLCAS